MNRCYYLLQSFSKSNDNGGNTNANQPPTLFYLVSIVKPFFSNMLGVVFAVVKLAYQLLVLHDSSHKCGNNGYSKKKMSCTICGAAQLFLQSKLHLLCCWQLTKVSAISHQILNVDNAL